MNIDFSQFHFIRPLYLFLFIGLAWLIWRVYQYSKNSNSWTQACDPNLLSYLLVGVEKKKGWVHLLLLVVVGALLIVAMAGPTWSKLPQAVYKKESAKVFVLDLSRSMDATDLAPSRASRAKLKLIDFLEASAEGQSALVVYANSPHIVSPLTDDANTIVSMVPSLSTSIMPSGGGRADRAIMKAAQLLTQAGHFEGDIILFTDGVDINKASNAAEKVASAGYKLHVIGVGTAQGSPIPLNSNSNNNGNSGGFLKDNKGNIVIPKFKRSELRQLALSGSGIYSDITVDNKDVDRLTKTLEIENSMGDNIAKAFSKDGLVKEVDLWRDQGHLFLLLALPFAALSFRRGWLGSLLLLSFVVPTQEVYAADTGFNWDDLWINKNTQAQQALNKGNAEKAAELFEDPQWKGTAQYKNNDFEKAEEQFLKEDTAESYYNAGNALAQQGKLQEAIEAYNNTLEREPKHRDAIFNKTLVQKIIDKQEKDQDQKSDDQQDSDEKNKDDLEKEDSDQENSDQESSDQENSDQEGEQNESDSDQKSEEEKNKEQDAKDKENKEAKEQEQKQKEDKKDKEDRNKQQNVEQTEEEKKEQKEIEQATEQWLRRIPDDPGGLLREKMRRQNIRDRQRQRTTTGNQW